MTVKGLRRMSAATVWWKLVSNRLVKYQKYPAGGSNEPRNAAALGKAKSAVVFKCLLLVKV